MLALTLAFAIPDVDGAGKIVVFLLMLSTLVVLHEYGHFILARLNGVRVNDFAVGFGPTLLKWTSPRSGTNYRLNLLPIGGYCAMQGEDGKSSEAEQQRKFRDESDGLADNFQAKTPWQRLAIVVAGPVANFILAYVILLVAAVTFGIASSSPSTTVGPLQAGSPAEKAGLQLGDRIVAIDGVPYTDGNKLIDKISSSAGIPLKFTYERAGVDTTVTIVPRTDKDDGKVVGRIGFIRLPAYQRVAFIPALSIAATQTYETIASQLESWRMLISQPGKYASSISGPIGMGRAATMVQDLGWGPYLNMAAMISVALGILNLLPFPALDGGRAAFIIAEMLRGRPVEPEREALVHVTGLALLMCLMVFVAYHDIANIISGKGVF